VLHEMVEGVVNRGDFERQIVYVVDDAAVYIGFDASVGAFQRAAPTLTFNRVHRCGK